MAIAAHGVTHPGRVRAGNEDAMFFDLSLGLFLVADGMGGHNAGEVASTLAVDAIRTFVQRSYDGDEITWPYGIDSALSFDANRLLTSVKLANRRVFKASESYDEYTGMGTTVVAALIDGARSAYAGVGDSRIYSYVKGTLAQVTSDDSWLATVLAEDPDADPETLATHPMRNVLTNVIGARDHTDVEIREHALQDGEMLLLCSDGLHGVLGDAAIRDILAQAPDVRAAERLVDAALARNASDNVTALVVQYTHRDEAPFAP